MRKSNHYFLLVLKSLCINVKVRYKISLLIFKIYKYVFFSSHHFLRALKFPVLRGANISISKSRNLNFPSNNTEAFSKSSHSYGQNQQIQVYCNIWGEILKISKLKNTHLKKVSYRGLMWINYSSNCICTKLTSGNEYGWIPT